MLIDTTYLTQAEQVDRIVALARALERGWAPDAVGEASGG